MKRRHVAMTIALAASAWLAFFAEPKPSAEVVEAVVRASPAPITSTLAKSAANQPGIASGKQMDALFILALLPRESLIRRGTDNQRTLFGSHNWAPPPPVMVPSSPALSVAPPLPFQYLGKSKEADQWQVFLSRGEVTFIVKENDIVESVYQVQKISPPSMSLLYLPLNETQSLTIE